MKPLAPIAFDRSPSRSTRTFHLVTGIVACAAYLAFTQFSFAQTPAQHPWQKMQMPTMAEVKRTWKPPPPEYGPEPYYGLNGLVTREVLQRDLDTAKQLGFHAVTVQPGRGNKEPYLSPEYFALFKVLVEEAKARDLRVWIIDDAGYPSGFAGGLISSLKPELRMQALTIAQTLPSRPANPQAAGRCGHRRRHRNQPLRPARGRAHLRRRHLLDRARRL